MTTSALQQRHVSNAAINCRTHPHRRKGQTDRQTDRETYCSVNQWAHRHTRAQPIADGSSFSIKYCLHPSMHTVELPITSTIISQLHNKHIDEILPTSGPRILKSRSLIYFLSVMFPVTITIMERNYVAICNCIRTAIDWERQYMGVRNKNTNTWQK